jgi:hypothetical protein
MSFVVIMVFSFFVVMNQTVNRSEGDAVARPTIRVATSAADGGHLDASVPEPLPSNRAHLGYALSMQKRSMEGVRPLRAICTDAGHEVAKFLGLLSSACDRQRTVRLARRRRASDGSVAPCIPAD